MIEVASAIIVLFIVWLVAAIVAAKTDFPYWHPLYELPTTIRDIAAIGLFLAFLLSLLMFVFSVLTFLLG